MFGWRVGEAAIQFCRLQLSWIKTITLILENYYENVSFGPCSTKQRLLGRLRALHLAFVSGPKIISPNCWISPLSRLRGGSILPWSFPGRLSEGGLLFFHLSKNGRGKFRKVSWVRGINSEIWMGKPIYTKRKGRKREMDTFQRPIP